VEFGAGVCVWGVGLRETGFANRLGLSLPGAAQEIAPATQSPEITFHSSSNLRIQCGKPQLSSRIAVPLRLRNTNAQPEKGSSASFSWHSRARESIPFRPSTRSMATSTRSISKALGGQRKVVPALPIRISMPL
jgi:hypothetical protein